MKKAWDSGMKKELHLDLGCQHYERSNILKTCRIKVSDTIWSPLNKENILFKGFKSVVFTSKTRI